MGKEDSMSVTGTRSSGVQWGGGGGRGNSGGNHGNRNRSASYNIAYYVDSVPYNAAGEVIITITGGPTFHAGVPAPAQGNYQVPTRSGFVYEVAVNNQNIITGVTVYPVTHNRGYVLANEEKRKNVAREIVEKVLAPKRAAAEAARLAAEEAERKRKAAEDAAKAQAEWDAAHPVEVAERQVDEVQQRINQAQQDKFSAEQLVSEKEFAIKLAGEKLKIAEDQQDEFVSNNPPHEYGTGWRDVVNNYDKIIAQNNSEIVAGQSALNAARDSLNQASSRIAVASREKTEAEAHLNAVRQKVAKDKEEADAIKDAVKFTADFYKELTGKYGVRSSKIAQELADAAKGKQIRNVDEALRAFDNHKDVLNKKFSVKDREAMAKALESVDRDLMAKNLAKFSRAFNYIGNTVDVYDAVMELTKAIKTDNWRPFFVKIEYLAAGRAAAAVTAFAFSIILGSPLGILGFAVVMTLVSIIVNDELIEEINGLIGI
ncbi:colicin-like pore-forming protein [Yersinia mollaretii]|uniref:colicin-like pore-forming protein n=1 Tax=Yersinia mollaretii TaxID=33060 RepID=UPI0021BD45ED|nr:colicin-like pore-forming protein [Yersinia mollaretii]